MKSIYFQIIFSFLYLFSFSQSTVLKVPDPIDIQSLEDLKSSGKSAKLLNCDVGVIDIMSPYTHTLQHTVAAVLVKFENFGTDTVFPNSLSIKFSYETYSFQTLYSDTLLPNSIDSIQFQNVIISPFTHWAAAMTILPGDLDSTNNIFWKRVYPVELKYPPYSNNFDLYDNWGNNFPVWDHGAPAGSFIDSAHSGPNVWMAKQQGLYQSNLRSYLASPAFDLSSLPPNDTILLSFWNAMNTPSGDGGLIEYSKDNGMNWHILGAVSDTNATNWYNTTIGGEPCWSGSWNWQEATYKLDPQQFSTSDTVIFRYKFFTNSYNNGFDGWAIDDFEITSISATIDMGVVSILQPQDTTYIWTQNTVKVVIKNFGNVTQYEPVVCFNINNNTAAQLLLGSLLPGQTDTIIFMPTINAPLGNSSLCAWTSHPNDVNNLNDTICKSIIAIKHQNDIGVVYNDIFKDPAFPGMNLYKVLVRVENFGTLPQTSFPINYEIPGYVSTITQTCNKMLMPGSHVIDTFSVNYSKPFGNYYVNTWTSLSTDQVTYNNMFTYWHYIPITISELEIYPNLISSINTEPDQNQTLLEQNRPNPSSGYTIINFYLATQGEYTFTVTNNLGQSVYSEVKEQTAGNHTIDLDLSNLVNGIYYYSIMFKGQKITKKMVVTK